MDVRAVYECVEYKKARERPGSLPTWTNECFDQMVELHPGAKSDYRTRGRVSHDRGNYDEALVDYASAIEQNPYDYHSYLFRGYTLAAMGDYRGAIADFTDTIRLNPKSYHAFSHRANAYEKLGMHEEAEADRERSKQLK
jgi:tetratricopeptide (TPR) repeat protein